jgi:DNA repair and recombination protein RAD54 and RAD54-like protein
LDLFKETDTLFEKNDLLVSNGDERACARKAGSVWDLIPGVKEDMFQHQQDAFEFVWRKLAGSTEIQDVRRTANTNIGGGCVISDAPGTGKTRLAITLSSPT